MRIFKAFLFLIFISSCSQTPDDKSIVIIDLEDFEEINLTSKKYFFEEVVNPSSIGFQAGKILIGEAWRVPEELPRMHLIDSKTWTYDRAKGKHGQGPLEITDAAQFLNSPDQETFWIYNMNRRKLAEFSTLDSSLMAVQDFKFTEEMMDIWFIELGPEGHYLGTPRESEFRFLEFDGKGKKVGQYGKFEKLEERPDLTIFQVSLLSNGWFKGNPELGIYVKAYLYRDILEIFNFQTKEFKSIIGPDQSLPEFTYLESEFGGAMVYDQNATYKYRDIAITENYIFALYGGHGQLDYNKTGIMAEQIWVFDHLGKPKWNLILDRSIIEIVINKETKELYGLTTDQDPGIAVFQLPMDL